MHMLSATELIRDTLGARTGFLGFVGTVDTLDTIDTGGLDTVDTVDIAPGSLCQTSLQCPKALAIPGVPLQYFLR